MSARIPSPDAETPVRQQLDAYNARDIDAFLACWTNDCQVFDFPATLAFIGKDSLRARHVERFQEPNLFGRLLQRVSVGDVVVDRELVTRTFPEGPGEVDVLAIYEVADGLIAKAWFKRGTPRLGGGPV